MSSDQSHDQAGGSPPPAKRRHHIQPEPYAQLLAKIEEVEGYSHTVLLQFPKAERHLLCAEIRASLNTIQRLAIHFKEGRASMRDAHTRVASFLAYTRHCDSARTVRAVLGDFVLTNGDRHDPDN